ncbi:MAG: flagellar biosynthesis protein FlhF [Tindallia sp. MSAO_Bac2]|nr:MAG: flagellar biosynthesis protein FlhF [Tindallia sp. MSAO_Bac2]
MKIKRFTAKDNQEALMKVRLELGSDAVIIHQRKIKPKGILGFFKKPIIEVVAAREEQSETAQIEPKPKKVNSVISSQQSANSTGRPTEELESELQGIKQMLSQLMEQNEPSIEQKKALIEKKEEIEENILDVLLKEQEIDPEIASRIRAEIGSSHFVPHGKNSNEQLSAGIRRFLQENIHIKPYDPQKKIIVFVGPTGVGKTTTIAKLAARATLNEGKKVGMISADTYRIAAVEQLKTYSDILNIPLEVIYNASEIHEALNRLKDKDIIMIDTAGRNHKEEAQLNELKTLLDTIPKKEVYLLLSCTTRNHDIQSILKHYEFLEDYKIIITKIDEASAFGPVLNVPAITQKPISFLTTGQSVPDDIEVVTIDKVITLLIKESLK